MGQPATDAAIIQAASQAASTAANVIATSSTNRKTRKWNEQQMEKQRNWALADRDFENQYNSPAQQMARLKAAGLNPNLVYGSGTAATASADVRGTPTASWNPQTPDFTGLANINPIMAYQDFKTKTLSNDILAIQQKAIEAEIANKNASTLSTLASTDFTKSQHAQFNRLATHQVDALMAQIRSTTTGTEIALQANERAKLESAQSLKMGVENILSARLSRAKTRQEIENLKAALDGIRTDNKVKKLDLGLKELGISPTDPAVLRVLGNILNSDKVGRDLPEKLEWQLFKVVPDWLKKIIAGD